MAKHGKLEGRITIPTGGWSLNITDDTGTGDITLSAGDYYLSSADTGVDLLAELQAKLRAHDGAGTDWTVTGGFGEGGTGKTTIAYGGATSQVNTWTDTDLRDVLGYTAALTGATSYVSPNHARNLWLPDRVKTTPYGDADAGDYLTDARSTRSNSGHVNTLYNRKMQVLPWVRWDDVSLAKTRISGESTTRESFEQFWIDAILAEANWSSNASGPLRLYWDAADDATYLTFFTDGNILRSFRPAQVREGWTGAWSIVVDSLVKEP